MAKIATASSAKDKEIAAREEMVAKREQAVQDVRNQLAQARVGKKAAEDREEAIAAKLKECRQKLGEANEAKHKIEVAMQALLAEKNAQPQDMVEEPVAANA